MKKIMAFTHEQESRFPEFVRKWIDIGLSTEPAASSTRSPRLSALARTDASYDAGLRYGPACALALEMMGDRR